MLIDIDDISFFAEKIIERMKEKGISQIEIDKDFYWDIPDDNLYDPYQVPQDINLGQLSHDLEQLIKSKEENYFILYNLKHLSSLLKFISIKYQL